MIADDGDDLLLFDEEFGWERVPDMLPPAPKMVRTTQRQRGLRASSPIDLSEHSSDEAGDDSIRVEDGADRAGDEPVRARFTPAQLLVIEELAQQGIDLVLNPDHKARLVAEHNERHPEWPIRQLPGKGYGVFSRDGCGNRKMIGEYYGATVTPRQVDELPEDYDKCIPDYFDRNYIDADFLPFDRKLCFVSLINDPGIVKYRGQWKYGNGNCATYRRINSEGRAVIEMKSTRVIQPGEELLFPYGEVYWHDKDWFFPPGAEHIQQQFRQRAMRLSKKMP